MTRKFSSISIQTTLSNPISNTATSITVADATNLMGGISLTSGDQFTLAINPDTAFEEIIYATAVNTGTNSLTVVRAQAGTSAIAHATGATIKHMLTGADLTYFESTLQGLAGTITVDSTDTLTNKTIDYNDNTLLNIPSANLTIAYSAKTATTYTFISSDVNKLTTLSNTSPITVTVPPSIFATGQQIHIQQIGTGQVTIAPGSGVTITGTGTKLRTRYCAATILCTGTNTFTVVGDLV